LVPVAVLHGTDTAALMAATSLVDKDTVLLAATSFQVDTMVACQPHASHNTTQ